MIKSSEYVTLDLGDYLKYLCSKTKTIIIVTLLGAMITACFSFAKMEDKSYENKYFLFNDEETTKLRSYVEYKNSIEVLEEKIKNSNNPEEIVSYSEAIETINKDIEKLQLRNDCLNRFSSYEGTTQEDLELFLRSEVVNTTVVKINRTKVIITGASISLICSVLFVTNYYLYFIVKEKNEEY